MPPKPRQPVTAPQMDPNQALSFLSKFGIDPSSVTGINSGSGGSVQDVLQNTLLGMNPRQGLGGSPLTGILPRWFKGTPQLASSMRDGTFDPYMPMPDISSWQVYTPRPHVKITGSTNATAAESAMSNLDTKQGDATQSVAAVKNQPYLWTQEQVNDAIKKFNEAGYKVSDLDGVVKVWGMLTEQAGARYSLSSGRLKVTPWDMLAMNKDANATSPSGSAAGSSGGSPSTVTQRSRTVSTITNGDGWSVLQNTLSRMLGRDPTDSEVRDFVGRMNHLASAHPTISVSTRSGIGTGHETVNSHTVSPGFDQNDILQNAYQQAQANPDYAEHQAATTYFNAALSALGAIGG